MEPANVSAVSVPASVTLAMVSAVRNASDRASAWSATEMVAASVVGARGGWTMIEHFGKADPIGDEKMESVTLVFDLELTERERKVTDLQLVRERQVREGERLELYLYNILAGGVYDQLLAAMLSRKASLLRVRHERRDKCVREQFPEVDDANTN